MQRVLRGGSCIGQGKVLGPLRQLERSCGALLKVETGRRDCEVSERDEQHEVRKSLEPRRYLQRDLTGTTGPL